MTEANRPGEYLDGSSATGQWPGIVPLADECSLRLLLIYDILASTSETSAGMLQEAT